MYTTNKFVITVLLFRMQIKGIVKQSYAPSFCSPPVLYNNGQMNSEPISNCMHYNMLGQFWEMQSMQFQMMINCHTQIMNKLIDKISLDKY